MKHKTVFYAHAERVRKNGNPIFLPLLATLTSRNSSSFSTYLPSPSLPLYFPAPTLGLCPYITPSSFSKFHLRTSILLFIFLSPSPSLTLCSLSPVFLSLFRLIVLPNRVILLRCMYVLRNMGIRPTLSSPTQIWTPSHMANPVSVFY